MQRFLPGRPTLVRLSSSRRRLAVSVELLETRALLTASAVISWQMAPQIAPDAAHGNAPDLPNTSAYVNPSGGYEVMLDASHTPGIGRTSTYSWTISEAGQTVATVQGEKPNVSLPQGPYTIQLAVNGVKGASGPVVASQAIVVKDVLIVSIGDSYASGEGNPVVNGLYFLKSAQWAHSTDPAMNLENAKAHRSTLAAPAQFALALQKANPHEAVTFVSVADSGATIEKGLLGPMPSDVDPSYTLPGEIDEVHKIVGTHPIDVLTVSIGGNDIGFSTRLQQLASNAIVGTPTLSAIQSQVNSDLAALPQEYAKLGNAIGGLAPAKVLITQYPDLTRNQNGQYAPIKLAGLQAINKANVQFADQNLLTPLNQAIATAASSNGWTLVDGLAGPFRTHGYPSTNSWIRNVGDSLRIEGSIIGAFHPNGKGQQAIAGRLLTVYNQSTPLSTQTSFEPLST